VNHRLPWSAADRFSDLARRIVGKHLTYKQLIGKVEEKARVGRLSKLEARRQGRGKG